MNFKETAIHTGGVQFCSSRPSSFGEPALSQKRVQGGTRRCKILFRQDLQLELLLIIDLEKLRTGLALVPCALSCMTAWSLTPLVVNVHWMGLAIVKHPIEHFLLAVTGVAYSIRPDGQPHTFLCRYLSLVPSYPHLCFREILTVWNVTTKMFKKRGGGDEATRFCFCPFRFRCHGVQGTAGFFCRLCETETIFSLLPLLPSFVCWPLYMIRRVFQIIKKKAGYLVSAFVLRSHATCSARVSSRKRFTGPFSGQSYSATGSISQKTWTVAAPSARCASAQPPYALCSLFRKKGHAPCPPALSRGSSVNRRAGEQEGGRERQQPRCLLGDALAHRPTVSIIIQTIFIISFVE